MPQRLSIALLLLFSAGCQRPMYDWGTYEESVYRMYSAEGDFSAAQEVDRLQGEIERTERRQRAIPPGKMAHLGYLYLMMGDNERARGCFAREKDLFPESARFMDFLLGRME
jgi:hypothetical protein